MNATEVITSIIKGEADENLDGVAAAVRDRQKAMASITLHTIAPGTRVRLGNLRPKYMVGATGTVLYRKQTRIQVKLDEDWVERFPQSRFGGGEVAVTAGMITVLP